MKVFAISGHAQNGKDTVASIMSDEFRKRGYKVLVTHYADLLKYICKTYFGWDGKKDENGRHILQYVGTDVVREQAPDFWVDFIISILKLFDGNWDFVFIPDSRFPNEIEKLKSVGLDVTHLRVERTNFVSTLTPEQQKHPSETALDNVVPDVRIINDGTLENLTKRITTYMEDNGYGS